MEGQTKNLDGAKFERGIGGGLGLGGLSSFSLEAGQNNLSAEQSGGKYGGFQILKNEGLGGNDSHYRRGTKAGDGPKKEHLVSIKSLAVQGLRSVEISPRSSVNWSKRGSRVLDPRLREKVAKRGRRQSQRSSCDDSAIDERSLKQSDLDYAESKKRFDTENSVGFQDPKMQPTQSYREEKFITYQKFKEISNRESQRAKLTHRNIFCAETVSPVQKSPLHRPRFVGDSQASQPNQGLIWKLRNHKLVDNFDTKPNTKQAKSKKKTLNKTDNTFGDRSFLIKNTENSRAATAKKYPGPLSRTQSIPSGEEKISKTNFQEISSVAKKPRFSKKALEGRRARIDRAKREKILGLEAGNGQQIFEANSRQRFCFGRSQFRVNNLELTGGLPERPFKSSSVKGRAYNGKFVRDGSK